MRRVVVMVSVVTQLLAAVLPLSAGGKGAAEVSGEWDLYKVENYFGGQSALSPLKMLG